MDDSGKEKDSPSLVLAGYSATFENWQNFTKEWRSILGNADIKTFHMVDAWRMGREYQKIGRLNRNKLLIDLANCIQKYVDHAFVLSIDMDAFRHWFGREELPDIRATRPYFIGFHTALTMICDHFYHLNNDENFMIFFDEQGGESASHTLSAVELLRNAAKDNARGKMHIPTPQYATDDQTPPLQAADMLAWLCRRENYNYRRGKNGAKTQESNLLDVALSMPSTINLMGDDKIMEIANGTANRLATSIIRKGKPN